MRLATEAVERPGQSVQRSSRLRKIAGEELPELRRALLQWFSASKRDLPWRRTTDPYLIWISEIMLQQTRVAAVVPYFERFTARFPAVRDLARAPEEAVLQSWTGLGYYSRARNLRLAAKKIAEAHGGKFPCDFDEAMQLPGIGSYTAAAVLSIAYGRPHAVLDGNVARVLARLLMVRGDLRRPRTWKRLQAIASYLLAPDASGDWNQAVMELGATLCTPLSPRCCDCPIRKWCKARESGLADRVPSVRIRKKTVHLKFAVAVLVDRQGRTLLTRHGGKFFSGLWQFPAIEVANAAHPLAALRRHLKQHFQIPKLIASELPVVKHTVTFHHLRLLPFLLRVNGLPHAEASRKPKLSALDDYAISSATRKVAKSALAAL